MVIYLKCSPINEDVRLAKYIQACESRSIVHKAITWDRLQNNVCRSNEVQFKKYAPYGRMWGNFINKFIWQFFVLSKLIKYSKEYKVIHACDFDTVIPALFFSLFFKKKVIYDVYDSYSSGDLDSILNKIIFKIDRWAIAKSDVLILADLERTKQMSLSEKDYKELFIVENVPNMPTIASHYEDLNFSNIKLSYVGTFDRLRGLEDLLQFVELNQNYVLNIAGVGTLTNLVEEMSAKCSRIIYHGPVNYNEALNIMNNSNIIIGFYYKALSNHIYAAPNKYFEALFLSKPLLTTKGTLVGEKVQKHNTGFAIEEGLEEIQKFFENDFSESEATLLKYREICINANRIWSNSFINYYNDVIKNNYIDTLLKL